MDTNIIYLIRQLHLPVVTRTLRTELLVHFRYPSLWALTDVLDKMEIRYKAIETDLPGLINNGFPCLVHLKGNRKEHLVVLLGIENENFHIYDHRKLHISERVFMKSWTGHSLYIFPPEKFSIKDKFLVWKKEIVLVEILVSAFILSFLFIYPMVGQSFCINLFIWLSLILMGLVFSFLLIRHEAGDKNLTKEICNMGKHLNCDAVLASSASKIFGLLSLADVGMVYFGSQLFCLVYGIFVKEEILYIGIMGGLSVLTLPYILYSLWYQGVRIKKWCPLCLSVIVVLISQIVSFFVCGVNYRLLNAPFSWLICLSIFILTGICWTTLHDLLKYFSELKKGEIQLLRLKYDPLIFTTQLKAVDDHLASGQEGLLLGSREAKNSITLVVNLSCHPCGKAYIEAANYLNSHYDRFSLRIYILVFPANRELVAYFYQIYKKFGCCSFRAALMEWFNQKDEIELKKHYPVGEVASEAFLWCDRQMEWCRNKPIRYTPFLFFNDKIVPANYSVSDVLYFSNKTGA